MASGRDSPNLFTVISGLHLIFTLTSVAFLSYKVFNLENELSLIRREVPTQAAPDVKWDCCVRRRTTQSILQGAITNFAARLPSMYRRFLPDSSHSFGWFCKTLVGHNVLQMRRNELKYGFYCQNPACFSLIYLSIHRQNFMGKKSEIQLIWFMTIIIMVA